jgi:ion channel
MESQSVIDRPERWLDRRVGRKGQRPRDAAYLIGAFWAIAVIVFGVVERLLDPKTFHSVWLGMWWATETVTTVGYGDIVPDQTAGKIIAGFLMLGGLSLLCGLTWCGWSVCAVPSRASTPSSRPRPCSAPVTWR